MFLKSDFRITTMILSCQNPRKSTFFSKKCDFLCPTCARVGTFGCPKLIQNDPLFRACECVTLIFATHIQDRNQSPLSKPVYTESVAKICIYTFSNWWKKKLRKYFVWNVIFNCKNHSLHQESPKFSPAALWSGTKKEKLCFIDACRKKSPPVRAAKIFGTLFRHYAENLKINTASNSPNENF